MQKVLILYTSALGLGHKRCAEALDEVLKKDKNETLLIDALHYINPLFRKTLGNAYLGILKTTPNLWGGFHNKGLLFEVIQEFKEGLERILSPKFKRLIKNFKPDQIICTQGFPCGIIANLKRNKKINLPLYAVITDFDIHKYWIYPEVNKYFVANKESKLKLIENKIPSNNIHITGIPISLKFKEELNKKNILKKLKLNDTPILTILGGGAGLTKTKKIIKNLDKIPLDFQIIVVTGKNIKNYNQIKDIKIKKNIKLLQFIENLNEIYTISDLIIGKPGGLTSSETLSKKVPSVIINPIPGQEESNTYFLTKNKAAIKINKIKNLHNIVHYLLKNKQKLKELENNINKLRKPDAAYDIIKIIKEDI